MLAALGLAACASLPTTPTPTHPPIQTKQPFQVAETSTPFATDTAVASPSVTLSPLPPSLTPTPPAISPANASSLIPRAKIQFSSWELVLAAAWSPDGETLAVAAGEKIHLYRAGSHEERLILNPGVWTPGLAFSPDSRTLACGGRDGVVQLWDVASGDILFSMPAHKKGVNSVAFSPDGRMLASAGNDGMVRLWDSENGGPQGQMIGGAYAIPSVVFTQDSASLAIANGDIIRFRDVETQRFVLTLRGDSSFYSLALAPDGQFLASGDSNNTVLLWDLSTEKVSHSLQAHNGDVSRAAALIWRVAFCPDARLLVSAGGDQTVRVWDATTGQLLSTLIGHKAAVTSLAFSPDGRWLVTGGLDATVFVWGSK